MWTSPAGIIGPIARSGDHSSDPFPAPEAPATNTCLPSTPRVSGLPCSSSPTSRALEVDLARVTGDLGCGHDAVEGHLPLHHDGEHGGADLGDRDPVGEQGGGEGVGLLGPGVQVLPAGHPHVQGVDRAGGGADPQHPRDEELAGAAVVPHQVAVDEDGGPAAAAVDGPAAPVAAQPGGGPAVEGGRVHPRPHDEVDRRADHGPQDRPRTRATPPAAVTVAGMSRNSGWRHSQASARHSPPVARRVCRGRSRRRWC